MTKFGKDIGNLLKKLLIGYHRFFHNDVLNSDGRKIFEEIVRMIVYEHPEYRRLVYKVRRNPDLEHVLKIASLVLGEEKAMELLKLGIGINTVYEYEEHL
ncbi:hypothetical protein J4526_09630 [Desulfurococcaceae archaeon MEX13E-LK6-19]|nr:hypothetical protein J4526_09630 [Desulfurococcaceae archaeon MEX13E-LK6-19]